MNLISLRVENFRSIKSTLDVPITDIHAFIGENNSGKSNLMQAISTFCTAGAADINNDDFNDTERKIIVKATFDRLSAFERKRWRPYLVSGNLILEKHFDLIHDEYSGKDKVKVEFHGYKAEPKLKHLSIYKIEEENKLKGGGRINWLELVKENSLPEYFLENERCNKSIYIKALQRYLEENDIEYDEPNLSNTHALGLTSKVVASLPQVHILKAITDYSKEIEKRSTTTTFRKLIADISDRILRTDPRYQEINESIQNIHNLLNPSDKEPELRIASLDLVENTLTKFLKSLMPSVEKVKVTVSVSELRDMFSSGVELRIDDGVDTDVLLKGHGLQRCLVFSMLRTLIKNERERISSTDISPQTHDQKSIILSIEEPELYIHPQLCKLFYDVMVEFSETDQVIYSTHSPQFIDAYNCDKISIISKLSATVGTEIQPHDSSIFADLKKDKIFQGLTRLNPAINEMFFARNVLLVEGPEDQIAIIAVLKNEGKITNRVEELDWSIVVAGGKPGIPFFQRVLSSFSIPYTVLHDLDVVDGMNPDVKETEMKRNDEISSIAQKKSQPVVTFPIKLERTVNFERDHFKNQFEAHSFFEDPNNLTSELRSIVNSLFK